MPSIRAALRFVVPLGTWLIATSVLAQEGGADAAEDPRIAEMKRIEASLDYRKGKIELGDKLAQLDVPEAYRFLAPTDARKVLEGLWGNPEDPSVLGLIVPTGVSPTADESWAIHIEYVEDGHVDDDDAADLDYDDLLQSMKEADREQNKKRTEAGYPAVELIGWAAKPHYDAKGKRLYWAKELQFAGAEGRTLNYDIRILGRKGMLVLKAIASMKQLPDIEKAIPTVLGMVEFQPGKRYADFSPGVDKVAAYGIGALVAGKIAAKVGLFKLLVAAVIAGKKLILLGLVALGALFVKLRARRRLAADAETAGPAS